MTEAADQHTFFGEIHRLRGLAILFVVGAHCCSFFDWHAHLFGQAFAQDLFDDATVFFVFIAGFLFQVTEVRFVYTNFLLRKMRHVGSPYLVAITPAIIYAMVRGTHAFDANTLNHLTRWEKIGYMLLNGGSTLNYALWFIPVIWIYFLASPLLIRIDRQPYRYGILLLLYPLSLLLFRPVYTGGHNLVLALYFLSAFVLGMACSRFRHHTLRLIDAHLLPIVTVTAVIFFGHLFLSNHHGKYTTDNAFDHQGNDAWIDWMFLQKTCMTVTLLGLLRRFQIVAMPILDRLGDASFTIYFYHLYVIFTVSWLTHNASIEIGSLRLLLLMSAAIGLPYALSRIAHKRLPRLSRSLVGS